MKKQHIKPDKKNNKNIFYFPDYSYSNPYQNLLYKNLASDFKIDSGNIEHAIKNIKNIKNIKSFFHLHWLNFLFDTKKTRDEVNFSVFDFLSKLKEFRSLGGVIIWTIHNELEHNSNFKEIEKSLRKELCSICDIIHLHDFNDYETIKKNNPIPIEKLVIQEHGNYIKKYGKFSIKSRRGRINSGKRDIIYIGQLRKYKNIDKVISTAKKASSLGLSITISGKPSSEEIKNKIEHELTGYKNVTLILRHITNDELHDLLKTHDIGFLSYSKILTSGTLRLFQSYGLVPIGPNLPLFEREISNIGYIYNNIENSKASIEKILEDIVIIDNDDLYNLSLENFTTALNKKWQGDLNEKILHLSKEKEEEMNNNNHFKIVNKQLEKKDYQCLTTTYNNMIDASYFPEVSKLSLIINYIKLGREKDANITTFNHLIDNPDDVYFKKLNSTLNKQHYKKNPNPKLSIIVPVYNSGQYLVKCISSILNQTFSDFELIIVNDGSQDNSYEIIKEFKDNRIRIINNQEPSGNPGTPRNQALKISRGTYIGFVDSDDWLDENYYQSLINRATVDYPDIVFSGGFKNHLSNGQCETRKYNNTGFNDSKSTRYKFHDSFMIWDKIFHTRLINTFNIELGETKAAVDVPFIFKVYYYCNSVEFVDSLIGYNYRRESESSVTVAHRKNSNCDFEFMAYKSVIDWASDNNINDYYTHLIEVKMINSLLYTIKLINDIYFSSFIKKVKESFKKVNDESFKSFCIENKKWWLYKEFETTRDKDETVVREFFEIKKKEAEEKKYKKTTEVKYELNGNKEGILFFPAWITNNPYQKLFYQSVNKKYDVSIQGFSKDALCKRLLIEKKEQYKYIHLHWLHVFIDFSKDDGAEQLITLLKFAKEIGYQIIYTAHNIISHDSNHYQKEVELRSKVSLLFDHVLAHGERAKDIIIDTIGVEQEKIKLIKHGSYSDYYGEVVEPKIAREKLDLPQDKLIFLFFGNIKGYKGINHLLKAFDNVYKENSNIYLIIAGRALDPESLEIINKYNSHPAINLNIGFIEDNLVKYYFSAANYTVLPFNRIITSGSAVLSLSLQCPVIAPNQGVLSEIITDKTGFLFDDFYEMELIIKKIATSPKKDKSSELINFNSNYSWDFSVDSLSEIIN